LATYVRGSVYDASPETLGAYDIVLFAGVYYHLKNPVLALQRIRSVLTDRGILFIEGASATDYLAEHISKALPESKIQTIVEILDRLPLSYFDIEDRIYESGDNFYFPTTYGLKAILLTSGFRNVTCELKPNAFYKYSHRRLMGRAEADPEKSDPANQKHEHWIMEQDFPIINERLSRTD